ncbi:unnamed protein product [Urochloa humidicola]
MEEEDGYVLFTRIHGAPEYRPAHVHAAAPRTDAVRKAERSLQIYSLLAVQLDARVRLDTAIVRQEAARQLHVPLHEIGAVRVSGASFLINFDIQIQRDAARQHRALRIVHIKLQLLPWMHQVGALAALAKFKYRVRLCIEGIPRHARQFETVAKLLPPSSFMDDEPCDQEKDEEEECLRLWLWVTEPDEIALTGTLQLEEPVTLPQEGYAESLFELGMPLGVMRDGPATALEYEVIIHVDRVLDYSPPSRRRRREVDSDSDEEVEEEYPERHPFLWRLGVPDGDVHRQPMARRTSAHDRLGGRARDRSPPAGGGGPNLGLQQVPPSGPHDLPNLRGGGRRNFHHGSSSRQGGHHYRRQQLAWEQRIAGGDGGIPKGWAWRPKQKDQKGRDSAPLCNEADDTFLPGDSQHIEIQVVDPMLEEAVWALRSGQSQSAPLPRSVEPTTANADWVVPVDPGDLNAVIHAETERKEGSNLALHAEEVLDVAEHAALELGPAASPQKHATKDKETSEPAREKTPIQEPNSVGKDLKVADNIERRMIEWADLAEREDIGHVGPVTDGPSDAGPQSPAAEFEDAGSGSDSAEPPFDLNVECLPVEEGDVTQANDSAARREEDEGRQALGAAENHINKEGKEQHGSKHQTRGLTKYVVPLKKSLLCNTAITRPKNTGMKAANSKGETEKSTQAEKKEVKGEVTKQSTKEAPVDEQATILLLKASGASVQKS